MMPTPHEIAVAIVAAAKALHVDPLEVFCGCPPGSEPGRKMVVSRARAYAAKAIDHVFNRPGIAITRPEIARRVGVYRASWSSYFSSLEGRPTPWWSAVIFKQVCAAVIDCEPPAEQIEHFQPFESPPVPPAPLKSPPVPAPLKFGPLPEVQQRVPDPTRKPIGTMEPDGFRPAPHTAKRVLEDDRTDKRFAAPYVPVGRPVRKDDDFLRRAVENTQKMTPPPED